MIGRWTKVRMAACALVLLGLAGAIVRKAVQVQVVEGARLKELADRQHMKEITVAPRRGRVLDRNGLELATTVEFDSIFGNPRQLQHVPDAAPRLARALGMDVREVQRIIAQPRYFAWLRRSATPEQAAAVQALGLPGVGIQKEPGRVYPNKQLAATVLGHTNIDGRGLEGVELAFDSYLRGTGVQMVGLRDSIGRELLVQGVVDSTAAAGSDVVLSLDKYLSHVTETALEGALRKNNAKAAMAVVMDPRTGEILAMASLPGYDPHAPKEGLQRGARNRVITDEFEPGSTLKTMTFAAVLDAAKVRPQDLVDCQMGRMQIGKYTIRDDHPKGTLTAADVFKHSSNIGTYKIARRIGREELRDALVRFGFGRPTGVGLKGERRGTLHPVSRWGEIGFATHAFGQGFTVTPLQLAAAFAAVAGGGVYRPPRLALRVVRPDGRTEPFGPRPGQEERRVMSPQAARTLLDIMVGVTVDGTAKQAAIPGYPVAGKTGTAQKAANGRYGDKRVSSFVGIVPADDPRLVIAVVVDEPGVRPAYGGLVAAPAFREIAEAALRYLGVPPSVPVVATARAAPAPSPRAAEEAAKEGLGADLPAVDEGAEAELALAGEDDEAGDLVPVPDFGGMSLGQAIRAARRAGVELVPEGSGLAVSQMPRPGLHPRGSVCRVSFRPGG